MQERALQAATISARSAKPPTLELLLDLSPDRHPNSARSFDPMHQAADQLPHPADRISSRVMPSVPVQIGSCRPFLKLQPNQEPTSHTRAPIVLESHLQTAPESSDSSHAPSRSRAAQLSERSFFSKVLSSIAEFSPYMQTAPDSRPWSRKAPRPSDGQLHE